jgi:hypothetical protein
MIAFTRAVAAPPRLFRRDVWVANADGSGERNLSHRPLADGWLVGWSAAQR